MGSKDYEREDGMTEAEERTRDVLRNLKKD